MEQINENNTIDLELTFYDRDGVLVVPASGHYRIDDLYSNTVIKASTSFIPTSSTHIITIPSSLNTILDVTKFSEIRIVTIDYTYNTSDVGTTQVKYELLNLGFYS